MGFFGDIFFSIGDTISEFADEMNDIKNEFAQLGEDLQDIKTSTITSIVSGDGEIECASDIIAEADEIINTVNEKYTKKYNSLQNKLLKILEKQEKLFEEKKKIAQSLNFQFNSEIQIPNKIPSLYLGSVKEQETRNILANIYLAPSAPQERLYNNIMKFKQSCKRLEEARSYREDAKDYKTKVNLEIAKLKEAGAYIEQISSIFKEEKELLKLLKNMMENKIKASYSQAAKQIETLLSETVFDKDGHCNKKYEQAVQNLKTCIIKIN